jgi:hypothetical protein
MGEGELVQRMKPAATQRDKAEMAVFRTLTDVPHLGKNEDKRAEPSTKYRPNDANRVIELAKESNARKAAGKPDLIIDSSNPYYKNIRVQDVNAAAAALAAIKANPDSMPLVIADLTLKLKGRETELPASKAEAPTKEGSIKVRIEGGNTYMVAVKPHGDPTNPKDVVSVTVRSITSGNDVDAKAAYIKELEDGKTAVRVNKPLVPKRVQ